MTYKLSDAAEADLDGILDCTWIHYGPGQAERYYFELRETMALLADAPLSPASGTIWTLRRASIRMGST